MCVCACVRVCVCVCIIHTRTHTHTHTHTHTYNVYKHIYLGILYSACVNFQLSYVKIFMSVLVHHKLTPVSMHSPTYCSLQAPLSHPLFLLFPKPFHFFPI